MPFFVVVPVENEAAFRKRVRSIAGSDWETRGEVCIYGLAVPSRWSHECDVQTEELVRVARERRCDEIHVPHRVHCDEQALRAAGLSVVRGPVVAEWLRGEYLQDRLRDRGFDWPSRLLRRLEAYAHGTITEARLDRWLSQFDRLGPYRLIGEQLAQLL